MNQKLTLLAWICRLFIAGLFLYAAASKIMDPMTFAKQVNAYKILPDHLVNYVAMTLPWIEVYAAIAILLPLQHLRTAGALLCLGMLVVFIGAQVSVLERGLVVECGCFGKGDEVSWPGVAKRIGFAVCALIALVGPYSGRE